MRVWSWCCGESEEVFARKVGEGGITLRGGKVRVASVVGRDSFFMVFGGMVVIVKF